MRVNAILIGAVLIVSAAFPIAAQKPTIFDVSNVVVGASRIETRHFFAEGKWSDAGRDVGIDSTHIDCYKSLGFCEVANAYMLDGQAQGDLFSYDVLRWKEKEMIAVDSTPICVVNTLRADFVAKSVTLNSIEKSAGKDALCKQFGAGDNKTAFLLEVLTT